MTILSEDPDGGTRFADASDGIAAGRLIDPCSERSTAINRRVLKRDTHRTGRRRAVARRVGREDRYPISIVDAR